MFEKIQSVWRFSRPHTIYGTTVSVIGLYLLASNPFQAEPLGVKALSFSAFAIALVACLSANVYIVGLNQLFDVEIDRRGSMRSNTPAEFFGQISSVDVGFGPS